MIGAVEKAVEESTLESGKRQVASGQLLATDHLPLTTGPSALAERSDRIGAEQPRLSSRQQQVIALLGRTGDTNKGLANRLGLTERTIKFHISILLRKFGVGNRSELIVLMQRGMDREIRQERRRAERRQAGAERRLLERRRAERRR